MKKKNLKNNVETTKEKTCPNEAAFRYTWAGQDENFVCLEHAGWLKTVANAIAYHLQLIPIQPKQEISCRQIIK